MRSRSLRACLLKLVILVPLTLDNMVPSTALIDGHHQRVTRRIHLPRAVSASRSFLCKEPQNRAYNLRDLMQNVQQNPGETVVQPFYIVVKRCDGYSGCCKSTDKSCTPVASSIFYEEFEIEILSVETRGVKRQWIRVEQHGKCFCENTTVNHRQLMERHQPNVTFV
ncbi:uncharacterized protein LOC143365553 [Halictus rubicundus]|uniref:uncharacterized protein LOC143365553 n=1 Tax=Halictus rubicundus TaxID=77578 RepID=UPI004035A93E